MTRATDTLTTVLQVLDRADAKRAALAPPDAAELVELAQALDRAEPQVTANPSSTQASP